MSEATSGLKCAQGFSRSSTDIVGAPPVVMLSHDLWTQRFGASTNVLGTTTGLDGVPHEIVGVLPKGHSNPVYLLDVTAQAYVPLRLTQRDREMRRSGGNGLVVFGRLKDGVDIAQAQAEMNSLMAISRAEHKAALGPTEALITPAAERFVRPVRPALYVVAGSVLLLLLVACGNVANLLLLRAAGRRQEMGVRRALGAGRPRAPGVGVGADHDAAAGVARDQVAGAGHRAADLRVRRAVVEHDAVARVETDVARPERLDLLGQAVEIPLVVGDARTVGFEQCVDGLGERAGDQAELLGSLQKLQTFRRREVQHDGTALTGLVDRVEDDGVRIGDRNLWLDVFPLEPVLLGVDPCQRVVVVRCRRLAGDRHHLALGTLFDHDLGSTQGAVAGAHVGGSHVRRAEALGGDAGDDDVEALLCVVVGVDRAVEDAEATDHSDDPVGLDQLAGCSCCVFRLEVVVLHQHLDRTTVDAAVRVDALEVRVHHRRAGAEVDAGHRGRDVAELDRLASRFLTIAEAAIRTCCCRPIADQAITGRCIGRYRCIGRCRSISCRWSISCCRSIGRGRCISCCWCLRCRGCAVGVVVVVAAGYEEQCSYDRGCHESASHVFPLVWM